MSSATSSNPRGAVALMIGAALTGFDAGSIGFVLPAMRAATGADAHTASWLVSVFVAGMLVAIPATGLAVRRVGAGLLFRACTLLAAAGALAALLADGTAALLGARLLQGVGQGPMLPLAAAIVAMQWPQQRQGRMIGLVSLAYGVAFLVAMIATPPLLHIHWRAAFAVSLVTACAALLASMMTDRATPSSPGRARHDFGALLTREMAAIALLSVGTGIGQAVLVWFPTLAIVRLGVPAAQTSLLMLPLVAGGIAATVSITAVMDRVGARTLLTAGALATLAGVLVAVAAPASRAAFMVGAGALGLGITGLCGGPLRYAAARAVPTAEQGLAQSAVALLTNAGVLAGSMLLGALAGRQPSEQAGIEFALLSACAIMAVAFVPVLQLRAQRAD